MTEEQFRSLISDVTRQLEGRTLDADLEAWLNEHYSAESRAYQELKAACVAGVEAGWMCNREAAGIRYGRVCKPDESLHGFSIDVVDMRDVIGPHHEHPLGEIDLVMPLEGDARFDGAAAGWKVYPPGSAHHPTVSNGRALVLYLLPQGQINFTRTSS